MPMSGHLSQRTNRIRVLERFLIRFPLKALDSSCTATAATITLCTPVLYVTKTEGSPLGTDVRLDRLEEILALESRLARDFVRHRCVARNSRQGVPCDG